MYQENFSIQNQVNINNFPLFDKNLKRVNENLIKVNEYYSSKNNHSDSIENYPQVMRNKQPNTHYCKINTSINLYSVLDNIIVKRIHSSLQKSCPVLVIMHNFC